MMFKKFWGGGPSQGGGPGEDGFEFRLKQTPLIKHRLCSNVAVAVLVAFFSTGCAILVPPLPSANLKAPGWKVYEGQAVWRLLKEGRDIAGDVLVGTRSDGSVFVQFTKTPFPILIGQANDHQWQIEFPPQQKHYSGRGQPPKRLIWLYLPGVLAGKPPPEGWTWHRDASGWKLVNGSNGESLDGYFNESDAGQGWSSKTAIPMRAERNQISETLKTGLESWKLRRVHCDLSSVRRPTSDVEFWAGAFA